MKTCNLKKGDKITVLAGKDKGKTGSIIKVIPDKNRVLVAGINMVTKHIKPGASLNEKSGRVKQESPLHISNVALFCMKCAKSTRVGHKFLPSVEGKKPEKVRFCKKCGEQIDA